MKITLADTTPEPYAAVLQLESDSAAMHVGLDIGELDALILDLTAARHHYLESHP